MPIIGIWKVTKNCQNLSSQTIPIHDFKEIEEETELVRTFIEAKLESENWRFKILEKISTGFWFLFSYYLRLNPKARDNIPPNVLHYSEDKLPIDANRHRKGSKLIRI